MNDEAKESIENCPGSDYHYGVDLVSHFAQLCYGERDPTQGCLKLVLCGSLFIARCSYMNTVSHDYVSKNPRVNIKAWRGRETIVGDMVLQNGD